MSLFRALALAWAACEICTADPSASRIRGNIRGIMVSEMPHSDVNAALSGELADVQHRLPQLEEQLLPLFKTLPKNAQGKVGHKTVRIALHRFFASRYGWHIHGWLGSEHTQGNRTAAEDVQATFESRMGQGADLHGFAVMAATLEDLVQQEMTKQLKVAFELEAMSTKGALTHKEAERVILTDFLSFSAEHGLNITTKISLGLYKKKFQSQYIGNADILDWVRSISSRHLPEDDAPVRFDDLAKVTMDIAREFHEINDKECRSLEKQLQQLQTGRPGRIRLSRFYKSNLDENSLWDFDESPEHLRALGALDEEDPSSKYVIITNYMMSHRNCLKPSSIISICCQSLCEQLRTQVENEIKEPIAVPQRIVDVLVSMPLAVLGAPEVAVDGALSQKLREKLDAIASVHGGVVPLHGRLFSQLMHHAYPLECPFPQEGNLDQAAAEGLDVAYSHEEMQQVMDDDTCRIDDKGNPIDCGESADLPWSMAESYLETQASVPSRKVPLSSVLTLALVVVGVLLVPSMLKGTSMGKIAPQLRLITIVAYIAYAAGLLNVKLLLVSALSGSSALCAIAYKERREQNMYKLPKCV